MTKREIAEMFMEIYEAVDTFQRQMSDIGVDTGASTLQNVLVPERIAKLYGLTEAADMKSIWSAHVCLDLEDAASVKAFLDYIEAYAEKTHRPMKGKREVPQ